MSKKDVLLGFSGGTDSCASVHYLREQGYEVIGLTLNTTGDQRLIDNARSEAAKLNMELIIEDIIEDFRATVVDYFRDAYLKGHTPVPCTVCNNSIKWRYLDSVSKRLGIEKIATGHYFNINVVNNNYYICKGADPLKDQSYYLWGIPLDIRPRIITPMGTRIKEDVKVLHGDNKKESMGVCFLNGKPYAQTIKETVPEAATPGIIIDSNGTQIGVHEGIAFYTIGQKRGLQLTATGTTASSALCIIDIDARNNILIAGAQDELWHHHIVSSEFLFTNSNDIHAFHTDKSKQLNVLIRGIGINPAKGADIEIDDLGRIHIFLHHPAWAMAKGQSFVIYCNDNILGGGFIENYF